MTSPLEPIVSAEPLLGIAIPAYKRESLLERLLESIQTDFPVVVSDNGGHLSQEFKARHASVRFLNEAEVPVAENWNRAAAALDTEWVIMPGDDDLYYPDSFQRIEQTLRHTPSADIVFFGHHIIDEHDKIRSTWCPPFGHFMPPEGFGAIQRGTPARPPGIAFKSSLFQSLGGFCQEFKVTATDNDFYQRAALIGECVFSDNVVTGYRVWDSGSTSQTIGTPAWLREIDLWCDRIRAFADAHTTCRYPRALQDTIYMDNLRAGTDRKVNVYAFVGAHTNPSEFDFPASVTCVRSSVLDRRSPARVFDQLCKRLLGRTPLLKRLLKRYGIQVVSHCDLRSSGMLPSIAWIPDFQHIHLPHFFQPNELTNRNAQFKIVLAQADRVIVSSYAAYGDLKDFAPAHADKARVLQFCAVQPLVQSKDGEDVERIYGLKAPFFYLPNQFWAHKNHRLVIEALASLRAYSPDVQIVCSGALSDYRNPKHLDGLQQLITALGLQDHFKLLGLIPYHHIAQLMVRSDAVINPSHFEGWSTTVEEAKSLGAPLLLSDIKVHREQCTDGEALFFDPDDSAALRACMVKVLGGAWPTSDRSVRFAESVERHRLRVIEMTRTYQSIVGELILAVKRK